MTSPKKAVVKRIAKPTELPVLPVPKERPIIFSGPMVHALQAGRKSQTRRIIKDHGALASGICRYGEPGDLLWVKEAFKRNSGGIIWRAESEGALGPWTSPLFLKRSEARVILEVTAIRYERLQNISRADAINEGFPPDCDKTPVNWFECQWQAVNGTASWASNPLVGY